MELKKAADGIRSLFAEKDDLMMMLGRHLYEMDEKYFYCPTSLLPDQRFVFQWHREMRLTGPGRLEDPLAGVPDYFSMLKQRLVACEPGQFDNCLLRVYFGKWQADLRREDENVFQIQPLAQAEQTLLVLVWPFGYAPNYDMSVNGNVIRNLEASFIDRVNRDETTFANDSGYDVLVLPAPSQLGKAFYQAQLDYTRYEESKMAVRWQQFDISRIFYRQQVKLAMEHVSPEMAQIAYFHDYAVLMPTLWGVNEEARKYGLDARQVIWYSPTGVKKLHEMVRTLCTAALYCGLS